MLSRIENVCGLEPSFQVLDDGGVQPWSVYDAEMVVVCRCEKREHAELLRDLLNDASEYPIARVKALIALLSDEEWAAARPRMCAGCFDRLDDGETCYCRADEYEDRD
jgi:hypothetical protein